MTTCVFFRDDDVWELDNNFLRLHDFMKKNRIPISYAVIPGKMKPELVDFLNSSKEDITIMQHGYMHENQKTPGMPELQGISRNEQRELIEKGMLLMEKRFGSRFSRIFVPPYHFCELSAVESARSLGFLGISTSYDRDAGDMPSIPVHISVSDYSTRPPETFSFEELARRFSAASSSIKIIGVYTHHSDFNGNGWKESKRFFEHLAGLRNEGKVKFFSAKKLLEIKNARKNNIHADH